MLSQPVLATGIPHKPLTWVVIHLYLICDYAMKACMYADCSCLVGDRLALAAAHTMEEVCFVGSSEVQIQIRLSVSSMVGPTMRFICAPGVICPKDPLRVTAPNHTLFGICHYLGL